MVASGVRSYHLGVLDGDGIGPEIMVAAVAAADAALGAAGIAPVDWERFPMGLVSIAEHGDPLPASVLEGLAGTDGWLLGPHDSAAYPAEHRARLNPSGMIRKHFDLYANVRPARALAGAAALRPDLDLVIVRENTEGFYADRNMFHGGGEFMPTRDVALSVSVFTRAAIERVAQVACDLAMKRRRRLTIVHKANVLPMTSGMFLQICEQVASGYPDLVVDEQHMDAMAALLVRRGPEYDVIVTENMFGDILSDLTGELAGSLGTAPSLNASANQAMAQAAHGSAPDIAGQGCANPVAMMLSTAMLFDWLAIRHDDDRMLHAATGIRGAVESCVASGTCTPDMGGNAGTQEFTRSVVQTIERGAGR